MRIVGCGVVRGDVEPRMNVHTYAEDQFVEQPAIALLDAPAIGIGAAFFGNVVLTPCHHLLQFSCQAFKGPLVRWLTRQSARSMSFIFHGVVGLNCFHATYGSGHDGSIALALLSFLARTLALTPL